MYFTPVTEVGAARPGRVDADRATVFEGLARRRPGRGVKVA